MSNVLNLDQKLSFQILSRSLDLVLFCCRCSIQREFEILPYYTRDSIKHKSSRKCPWKHSWKSERKKLSKRYNQKFNKSEQLSRSFLKFFVRIFFRILKCTQLSPRILWPYRNTRGCVGQRVFNWVYALWNHCTISFLYSAPRSRKIISMFDVGGQNVWRKQGPHHKWGVE